MPPKLKIKETKEEMISDEATISPAPKNERKDIEKIGRTYIDLYQKVTTHFVAKYDLFDKVVAEENL